MVPRWIFRPFFLLTFTGITCNAFLTFVPRQDLYNQIANKHLLSETQLGELINVPASGVYRDLGFVRSLCHAIIAPAGRLHRPWAPLVAKRKRKKKKEKELVAKDCRAAYLNLRRRSGFYVLWPKDSPPLVVYCDLSSEGEGWTVLQRKLAQDNTSFGSRGWAEYKDGFGHLQGSHWLGNEMIHLLTRQNAFAVRFLLEDSHGNQHYADYSSFQVDSEANGYSLRLGEYFGSAGDALTLWDESGIHDNMMFSTEDRDNDRWDRNCAKIWKGGWWFDNCRSALLNTDGEVYWGGVCTEHNPCVATGIMIKPGRKNCSPIPLPGAGGYYPIHYS